MSRNLELFLRINGDGSGLGRTLRRNTEQVNRFKNSTISAFGEIRKSYEALNGFSFMSRTAATVGAGFSGRAALAGVVDLERAMLVVKSNIMSGTNSAAELQRQLQQVRNTARELSSQTIFSDAQMVELSGQLLKSGVSFGNLTGASWGAAALAQLGGISPQDSAAQLGALGNAFSFKSDAEYKALADQISRVDDASAMNSGMLLYNAQQAGATAASLRIDPKRMFAALGYLDPLGNEAGTSLNRFLGNMAGATPEKKKALAHSGMNFWQKNADGTTTLKDLGEVIEIVRTKFRGMKSDQERKALGHQLFGEEGERAAAFFATKDVSFAEFEKRVANASSATQKLEVQTKGLGASFDRLKNTAFAKFDTQFAPVRDGLNWVTNKTTAGIENGYLPEMLMAGAGALIGGRLAYKKWKSGKNAPESAVESALGGAAALQRVFVTNWPAGMLSPSEVARQKRESRAEPTSTAPAGNEPAKGPGRGARFGSGALGGLKWGAPLAVASSGYSAWDISHNEALSAEQKKAEYKKLAGSTAGSVVGGVIGGGVGALFGGFGAIPGTMIGSALGGMLGDWMVPPEKSVMDGYQASNEQMADKIVQGINDRPLQVNVSIGEHELTSAINSINSRESRRN